MSNEFIVLVGGGGHCRACIDVIESENRFAISGIVDQQGKDLAPSVLGYPLLGDDSELENLRKQCRYALVTVGQVGASHIRQRIFNQLKQHGFTLPVIISSTAQVSRHATIEEGTIVMHRTVVNAGAYVGKNCILNSGSLIEHDARIGDHTHISTVAAVNGDAVVGGGSFVGSNATIVHGVTLADNYFFKAGRLVSGNEDGKPLKEGS